MDKVHARRVDELLSIGEFSVRCGLSAKMLPSYAEGGLRVPAAAARISVYRYYSPGQVRDAEIVAALRQAGIAVAEIRDFVERPTTAVLGEWEDRLTDEMRTRRHALQRVRDLAAPAFAGDE